MTSRAVVIGPAGYAPDSGIVGHPEIGNSARLYGEVLAADPLWGAGQVTVLTEEQLSSVDGVVTAVREAAGETVQGDTLLVIYVGHGDYWQDVPGAEMHFAAGCSRDREPHTWVNSWYVYQAIRRSKATLKVLIADCCCSGRLRELGNAPGTLPGVLGQPDYSSGTCVLTSLKNADSASAVGCSRLRDDRRLADAGLREKLAACTPFSGHLLSILLGGTGEDRGLTLGMLRDAVKEDMVGCGHDEPRMILNDARESRTLFTNGQKRKRPARKRRPPAPASAEEWVKDVKNPNEDDLSRLLADPRKAGKVAVLLSQRSRRGIAKEISELADQKYQDPAVFARYWDEVKRAQPA